MQHKHDQCRKGGQDKKLPSCDYFLRMPFLEKAWS